MGLGALFGGISPPTPPPWRRDWFHFTISASQLVSGSVLGVFGSMVHRYIDWLIVLSNMTQHVCVKVVLRRSSRRGNAVSRKTFHVKYVNGIMFAKISGGNCPVCPFLVAALGQCPQGQRKPFQRPRQDPFSALPHSLWRHPAQSSVARST